MRLGLRARAAARSGAASRDDGGGSMSPGDVRSPPSGLCGGSDSPGASDPPHCRSQPRTGAAGEAGGSEVVAHVHPAGAEQRVQRRVVRRGAGEVAEHPQVRAGLDAGPGQRQPLRGERRAVGGPALAGGGTVGDPQPVAAVEVAQGVPGDAEGELGRAGRWAGRGTGRRAQGERALDVEQAQGVGVGLDDLPGRRRAAAAGPGRRPTCSAGPGRSPSRTSRSPATARGRRPGWVASRSSTSSVDVSSYPSPRRQAA